MFRGLSSPRGFQPARSVRAQGIPLKFAGLRPDVGKAPKLGEHTKEVLSSLLYDEERIKELERAGAI